MMNQKKTLISIITVVYNDSQNIENTIKSVIKLKKKNNVEYIVIDGDSKDDTVFIVKKYIEYIDVLVSENDQGIYDAMNKGVKVATGDWLLFMNSGDSFYNGGAEVINELFLKNPDVKDYDVIYGNTLVKNSGNVISVPVQEINRKFFFHNTICHQSVFFSKKVFSNLGNYNLKYKIISDRDLLFRVANSNGKFYHIDHIISVWDEDGFSKDNISLFLEEEILFKKQNFFISERYSLMFKKRLQNLLKKIKN